MRLDERPVIDQLTEPTPLNHLHDVEGEALDWLANMHETIPTPHLRTAERLLEMIVDELEARL